MMVSLRDCWSLNPNVDRLIKPRRSPLTPHDHLLQSLLSILSSQYTTTNGEQHLVRIKLMPGGLQNELQLQRETNSNDLRVYAHLIVAIRTDSWRSLLLLFQAD